MTRNHEKCLFFFQSSLTLDLTDASLLNLGFGLAIKEDIFCATIVVNPTGVDLNLVQANSFANYTLVIHNRTNLTLLNRRLSGLYKACP